MVGDPNISELHGLQQSTNSLLLEENIMSTLYLDDDMMPYADIFLKAITNIEALGYSFKPDLLIHKYTGRSKKRLGTTYCYPNNDFCLIELSTDNHKDGITIDTIYHELAHATIECHFKGHGKEFKQIRKKIIDAYKIDIGGAVLKME